MGARTKYRKRALDILFESELRGLETGGSMAERLVTNEPPVNEYTKQLVEGVIANIERIDEVIAEHARGWTLERMPAIDRNLARIAIFEILFVDDVPNPVAVSEAVDLAQDLSTDDSAKFLSGLLSAVA